MFNAAIYRSYDIRGIVPSEFNAEEAYHIGRAYAEHTKAHHVVVAMDMRTTGPEIKKELMRGLTEAGINVTDIGLATTPMFYFAVHHLKTEGGLMVTASHNPAKYNGVKMTREAAIPIGGDSGLMEIRDLCEKRVWQPVAVQGVTEQDDTILGAYLDSVCEANVAQGLKIVADAGNGMAGLLLSEVARRIGGEIVPLYWELDGNFPHHEANPLEEKNMKDVQAAVLHEKADFGVAFDGDSDRVFFCTEQGITVPGDITTALIATEVLKQNPGATILYDLRSSRSTKEVIEAAGGKALLCKVGHSNIKKQMRETGAIFAGELSGHFYFTPAYAESAMRAFMAIIKVVQEARKPLSQIVAPLLKYAKTPEINFEVSDKLAAIKRIKDKYADAEILELDGVTVSYKDWWANVRMSGTEPLLRLNMEANTPELLKEKQAEIETLIKA